MKFLAVFILCLCVPTLGWANRVALVIGNANYTSVAPLDNPQNDSAAVSRALTGQGFEVITGDNLGRVELRNALRRFRALADGSEIALVYYAGHGIEIGGVNYLVPVDARLEDERDAGLEMVEVDLVLRQISGARTLKMVVLDACRNNPFVFKMQRQSSGRNIGQGLGEIRSTQADTLISYAAAAGEITPDGETGHNSPFTAAFLSALAGPPMDVRRMLGRVRDQMRLTVPGAAPFVYSSLGGGEYIINPESSGEPSESPLVAASPSQTSISVDFVRIDRGGSIEDWDEFLIRHEAQFSHPLYAFALEKRAALQRALPNAAAPLVAQATTPRASGESAIAPAPTGTVAIPTMTIEQAAKSLQTSLKDHGCYSGSIDGIFGRNSRRGLLAFARQAGVDLPLPSSPDARQLWAMRQSLGTHPDVKCPVVVRRAPKRQKPRTQKPSAQTTARHPDQPKKEGPRFSNDPCPVALELRFERPECS